MEAILLVVLSILLLLAGVPIGQATPPVGVNLFTAASLLETDIDPVARRAVPFIVVNVVVLIVLSVFPQISLWLPVRLGLYSVP